MVENCREICDLNSFAGEDMSEGNVMNVLEEVKTS